MANLKRSVARLILSAVTSAPIFSAISFVSLRNKASGRPTKEIVQSGVNAQMNDVTAPPKKTIPMAEAASATSFTTIAKIIFGPGSNDFKTLTNVYGAEVETSFCFKVGIRNPSKACPLKPPPY